MTKESDPKKPKIQEDKLTVKTGLKSRTIKVDYLARVEGEGALYIQTENGKVLDVKLKIFESPRFFEAFLRGRDFMEAPDITSRICGICPIAYQMSAVTAMENALNLTIPKPIQDLRRVLYCGEWIESHSLHVYMLHAPDFLGFSDAMSMAKKHPELVKDGLYIKKMGNAIVETLGGREVHPINIKVGGFYKFPDKKTCQKLANNLKPARDKAYAAIKMLGGFTYPDFTKDYEFVALKDEQQYPMAEGRLVSTKGLNITAAEYDNHFEEIHVEYTNALHSKLKKRGNYFTGPMARYNINQAKLSPIVKQAIDDIKFESYCTNPFRSIIIRGIEILYAFDEAIRLLENLNSDTPASVTTDITPSVGYGITEAPRGILYHRYKIDKAGNILDAKIVPPTSQNQLTIEQDLWDFVKQYIKLPKETLTHKCEQAIRNYDPCISCATHFLKVHIN